MHSVLRHLPYALLLQKINRQPFGRPAAGIHSIQLVGLRVIHNRKQVPADSIHHRLATAHHPVRRTPPVPSIPPPFPHPHANLHPPRSLPPPIPPPPTP